MSDCSDFRVVVGLDFGTTFSLIKETVKSHWDGIASNDDDDDSSNNNDDVNYNDDDDDYVFNFLEKKGNRKIYKLLQSPKLQQFIVWIIV
ncbi:unnamed protein product [Rhizophagus irregularis]|nr:unnamed protein product [Rhizophagus irregularis]